MQAIPNLFNHHQPNGDNCDRERGRCGRLVERSPSLFIPIDEETIEIQESKGNADETYKSMEGILKKGKMSQNKVWSKITEELKTKGYDCDPVAVASSTELSTKKPKASDSAVGSVSGCSTKSNKTSIATLLQDRLRQKDEYEENKKKRYKETMQMNEKFVKVFEQPAEI
ncbi:hypothetical protein PV328_004093 [Microctonus aethiopoides]|uniref:Uncharacterized protein n=1 Tax=Microctonus aethiopoides TaxID=144406 RepID=A0AA39FA15_9HYME|nr:hypothetical protein PV328_004093 [Microctonus aethiopoides]